MAKKVTKKDMFGYIIDTLKGQDCPESVTTADLVLFCENEIALLSRRSSSGTRKPTKTQLENEEFKASILSYLKEIDRPACIKEMQSGIPSISDLTNQRVTHLLIALCKSGAVSKDYVKRVPYYCVMQ